MNHHASAITTTHAATIPTTRSGFRRWCGGGAWASFEGSVGCGVAAGGAGAFLDTPERGGVSANEANIDSAEFGKKKLRTTTPNTPHQLPPRVKPSGVN